MCDRIENLTGTGPELPDRPDFSIFNNNTQLTNYKRKHGSFVLLGLSSKNFLNLYLSRICNSRSRAI